MVFNNQNFYFTDFAVGSYLSGHTVVLRSYPAVTLTGSIYLDKFEIEAGEIDSVVNKFFITLYYSGKKSVDKIREYFLLV